MTRSERAVEARLAHAAPRVVLELLAQGAHPPALARALGVTRQAVYAAARRGAGVAANACVSCGEVARGVLCAPCAGRAARNGWCPQHLVVRRHVRGVGAVCRLCVRPCGRAEPLDEEEGGA